jgi:hypothetical protein
MSWVLFVLENSRLLMIVEFESAFRAGIESALQIGHIGDLSSLWKKSLFRGLTVAMN